MHASSHFLKCGSFPFSRPRQNWLASICRIPERNFRSEPHFTCYITLSQTLGPDLFTYRLKWRWMPDLLPVLSWSCIVPTIESSGSPTTLNLGATEKISSSTLWHISQGIKARYWIQSVLVPLKRVPNREELFTSVYVQLELIQDLWYVIPHDQEPKSSHWWQARPDCRDKNKVSIRHQKADGVRRIWQGNFNKSQVLGAQASMLQHQII